MKPLSPGARIGVLAPASLPRADDCERAIAMLGERGFDARPIGIDAAHTARTRHGDDLRADCLHRAFDDDELDALLCVRGGYGSGRIAHRLDYDRISRNRKIFAGYSDVTSLLLPLLANSGLRSFHAPTAIDLATRRDESSVRAFFEVLAGTRDRYCFTGDEVEVLRAGEASGPLIGGNLTVMSAMVGLPTFEVPDGAIVFFEDVDEFMYQQDRGITHLRLAGVFDNARAILAGASVLKDPEPGNSLGLTFPEMVAEHFPDFPGPIVAGVPCGHTSDQITLPLGGRATLVAAPGRVELGFDSPF